MNIRKSCITVAALAVATWIAGAAHAETGGAANAVSGTQAWDQSVSASWMDTLSAIPAQKALSAQDPSMIEFRPGGGGHPGGFGGHPGGGFGHPGGGWHAPGGWRGPGWRNGGWWGPDRRWGFGGRYWGWGWDGFGRPYWLAWDAANFVFWNAAMAGSCSSYYWNFHEQCLAGCDSERSQCVLNGEDPDLCLNTSFSCKASCESQWNMARPAIPGVYPYGYSYAGIYAGTYVGPYGICR